jgi:hypothetical protein
MRDIQIERHIVPALPGFNLLLPLDVQPTGVVDTVSNPIIAWRIDTNINPDSDSPRQGVSNSVPITPAAGLGEYVADGEWAVECPDGRCVVPFVCTFRDRADLFEYWRQQKADWEKKKRERIAARKGKEVFDADRIPTVRLDKEPF